MIARFARLLVVVVPCFLALAHPARAELSVRFLAERLPAEAGEVVMFAGETISEPFTPPTRHLSEEIKPPARAIELRTAKDRRLLGNYLINRTAQGIIGHIGATRFRIKPGTGSIIRPTGPADEGFYQVGFGVEEEEGARALSMTRWPVDSKVRSYVFFFNNPRTGRVDYRAVDEFVPAEKPE